MANLFEMVGASFVIVMTLMTVCWVIYYFQRNSGIVDIGWALGYVLTAWAYFFLGEGDFWRRVVLVVMVTLWGGRLALYLSQRFLKSEEDIRYQEIRKNWGEGNADFKFLLLFLFQGLLVIIISLSFLLICRNPNEWSQIEFWGIGVWFIGFIGESIADRQLQQFKEDPENRGRICQKGLWYYSRHPNYFFEGIVWIGFFLFALAAPGGYLAIISPALIYFFLLKVSGIPLTEEQSLRTKGEAYREYQRTTSSFIPWLKSR